MTMDNTLDDVHHLLDALRQRLDHIEKAQSGLLPYWPIRGKSALSDDTPSELPACAHFGDALTAALSEPDAAVARPLGAVRDRLRWTYSYPSRDGFEDLSMRIAFCQIVGSKG